MELANVRLVKAGPFRAAAFRAKGTEPETPAFEKLRTWAESKNLLSDTSSFLLFGRNDPPPEPDRADYGYVYMLTVPATIESGGGLEIVELPRSMYAVVRARLPEMNARWEALYGWAESSGLKVTDHGLEEHLDLPGEEAPENMLFDLWLPVKAGPERD